MLERAFHLGGATGFVTMLHGNLPGYAAYARKKEIGRSIGGEATIRMVWSRPIWSEPGLVPDLRKAHHGGWHLYVAPCLFRSPTSKTRDNALIAPCCWVDIDPPDDVAPEAWSAWRLKVFRKLRRSPHPPSVIVDSGRGVYAFWRFTEPVKLTRTTRALVEGLNQVAIRTFGGDPSSRGVHSVLRLVGSTNFKEGVVRRCKVVHADGPAYEFRDLVRRWRARPWRGSRDILPSRERLVPKSRRRVPPRPEPVRGMGRPTKAITLRDLRSLPARYQRLVIFGPAQALDPVTGQARYPTRSHADADLVTRAILVGFPEEKVVELFRRPDWVIGERYREKEAAHPGRGEDYVDRLIVTGRDYLAGREKR